MGSSFCWSSQEDRLTSPRISWQMERDFRNRHVVPAGSGSPPAKGWGRSSNSRCPDKLQESLKSPANMALQSHKLWDTNNPIDRNPTKGDAPTNSCSEPFFAYEHCYGTRPRTPKGETSKKTGTVFPHLIRLFLFAHS